jgi:hypothetical protein
VKEQNTGNTWVQVYQQDEQLSATSGVSMVRGAAHVFFHVHVPWALNGINFIMSLNRAGGDKPESGLIATAWLVSALLNGGDFDAVLPVTADRFRLHCRLVRFRDTRRGPPIEAVEPRLHET